MSPPFIAASTGATTGRAELRTHVVDEGQGSSLHLKTLDELVSQDLLEVIRKALKIGLLFS